MIAAMAPPPLGLTMRGVPVIPSIAPPPPLERVALTIATPTSGDNCNGVGDTVWDTEWRPSGVDTGDVRSTVSGERFL